jgi:uncharacterized protein (TIGR02147 family)
MPDIFQYTDYRKFLRDFYEAKKASQKGFTHRFISKALGFKSTGSFAQILQGKTNISTQMIANFVAFLKLKKEEGDYFELMVLFNQSKSHAEKKRYFEKVIAFPKSNFKVVDSNQYAYYEKWYYSVIREILAFFPFKDDFKELAKMLEPPISPSEAQKAVKLLEDLHFIKQDEQGYYKKVDAIITTGYEAKSLAINQFTLETMELARASLDNLPREERSLSTLTLSLPEDGYKMLEEKIKGFRRELLELAKNSEAPRRVLLVNFQIFPVSKVYHDGNEDKQP